MEIIYYKTKKELFEIAEMLLRTENLYDCRMSISFRIYNEVGNTLQLPIYYK